MSLTVLFIGFLHALPVIYVGLTNEKKGNDSILLTAVIMSVIAFLTGLFKFFLIDLFFIWAAYLVFASKSDAPTDETPSTTQRNTPATPQDNDFIKNLERNLKGRSGLHLPQPPQLVTKPAEVTYQIKKPAPQPTPSPPNVKAEDESSGIIAWLILFIIAGLFIVFLLFDVYKKPQTPRVVQQPPPSRAVETRDPHTPRSNIRAPDAPQRSATSPPVGSRPADMRSDLRHCLNLPTNEEIIACSTR